MPDLHAWITEQVIQTEAEAHAMLADPAPLLRRCEADRRILARHTLNTDDCEPSCRGCGTYGDFELANVDNINDCPELLDLANAHGLTDDTLATLDRPQPTPPPRQTGTAYRLGLADILKPHTAMADVPGPLRGPNWKGGKR